MQTRSGCWIPALLAGCVCIGKQAEAAVTISAAPTQGISCSAGTCTPTAATAVLNVTDLENALQAGNLSLATTGSGGVEATDISVAVPFSWNTANTLSLTSFHSIYFDKKVLVAGGGGLTVTTNTSGTDGRMVFARSGRVEFHRKNSPVVINGASYSLAASVADIAAIASRKNVHNIAFMNDYDAAADGTYSSSNIEVSAFEGFGNTISNYTLVDSNHCSLCFIRAGFFEDAGDIRDLRLLNINVTIIFQKGSVGGLAGLTTGTLAGDEVSGTVSGKGSLVGGLTGTSYGSIIGSYSTADVSGDVSGGLTGWQQHNGTILQSSAAGSVYSTGHVAGGLAGYLSDGTTISQSFATVHVATKRYFGMTGGLVGRMFETPPQNVAVTIINSYSRGQAYSSFTQHVGGFIGYEFNGAVTNCYSTTNVHHPRVNGGFAGYNAFATNTANYWDVTTSRDAVGIYGSTENGQNGVTGLTDAQLKSGLPASFDPAIWAQSPTINDGYPYLINNPPR